MRPYHYYSLAIISLWALVSFPSYAASLGTGGLQDHDGGYNYIPGSGEGPEDWGSLREEWKICKDGLRQSPINLMTAHAFPNRRLGRLETNYRKSHAVLVNRGHDVGLEWPNGDAGTLTIGGTVYTLERCHWHHPSEHAIDGKIADGLEMHMVHRSSDDRIAVVGVLFNQEKHCCPDPLLSKLTSYLQYLLTTNSENVTVGYISPWNLQQLSSYYRYNGSLTTPPCTQGVTWTVMQKVMTVTRDQVQLLRSVVDHGFDNNARPLQPINHRRVDIYRGSFSSNDDLLVQSS